MPSLQEIVDANPECETFRFGDSDESCATILNMVRAGRKTATCEAARAYSEDGDTWPEVGRQDVALNWDGTPAVMVETVAVETRRFNKMDAAFVKAQGEFRDLGHWQDTYRAYFEETGGFSEDMKVMCETFKVVEDFS